MAVGYAFGAVGFYGEGCGGVGEAGGFGEAGSFVVADEEGRGEYVARACGVEGCRVAGRDASGGLALPEDEGFAGSLGYYDGFGEGYVLAEGVPVKGDVFHAEHYHRARRKIMEGGVDGHGAVADAAAVVPGAHPTLGGYAQQAGREEISYAGGKLLRDRAEVDNRRGQPRGGYIGGGDGGGMGREKLGAVAFGVVGIAEGGGVEGGGRVDPDSLVARGVEEIGVLGGKGGNYGGLQSKTLSRYGRVDGGAARVWWGIVGLEVLGYVADHKVVGASLHGTIIVFLYQNGRRAVLSMEGQGLDDGILCNFCREGSLRLWLRKAW